MSDWLENRDRMGGVFIVAHHPTDEIHEQQEHRRAHPSRNAIEIEECEPRNESCRRQHRYGKTADRPFDSNRTNECHDAEHQRNIADVRTIRIAERQRRVSTSRGTEGYGQLRCGRAESDDDNADDKR